MGKGQVADHDIVVINIKDIKLGASSNREKVLMGEFGSLGFTRCARCVAEERSGFRFGICMSNALHVVSTGRHNIANMVQVQADLSCILR